MAERRFWAVHCDLVDPAAFMLHPVFVGGSLLWPGFKAKVSQNSFDLLAGKRTVPCHLNKAKVARRVLTAPGRCEELPDFFMQSA
jgi:hypothetical protein